MTSKENSLKAYWNFLLHPTLERKQYHFISKLRNFSVVLGVDVVIVTLLSGIIYGIEHLGLIDIGFYRTPQLVYTIRFIIYALTATVLIPLIEEVVFRLHLRPGKVNTLISVIAIVVYGGVNYIPLMHSTFGIIVLSSLGTSLLLGYFLFQRKTNKTIKRVWQTRFVRVFYVTALLFGGIHIFNYKLSASLLVLSPIVVAPQIFLGLNVGYLRVRFGFGWGILLHMAHNVIFIVIPVLLLNPEAFKPSANNNMLSLEYPTKVVAPQNYSLEILEVGKPRYNSCKVSPSGINFDHATVRLALAKMGTFRPEEVVFEDTGVANSVIDLQFTDRNQESMDDFKMARRFVFQQLLKKYYLKAQLFFVPAGNWVLYRSQFVKTEEDTSALNEGEKSFVLKDATIRDLADKIEELYSMKVNCLSKNRTKYTWVIPKDSTELLQRTLMGKYGVTLYQAKNRTVKCYISSAE